MPDRRIQTFLTLYETMSFHAAAAKLNLSQPAVTQQIHALEEEYGQKLFLYDHRTLSRTEAAQTLALYARSMLRSERLLRQELARQAAQPVLRIGATKTIGDFVIGGAVTRYLSDPTHNLTVAVDNTMHLLHLVEQDEIDFALVEGNFDRLRYGSRLLRLEPFTGICAKGHPFAGRSVPLDELLNETLLLREKGSGTRGIAERMLMGLGYTPEQFRRTVCISSFGLLCRLVSEGVGVSFVYRTIAEHWPDLEVFQLDGPPVQHAFHYVFLRDSGAEQAIDAFGPIWPDR